MSFSSWRDFEKFENDVKYKNRFMHSAEARDFLSNIKETLPERERRLVSGSILFRSQIGYEERPFEGQVGICGFPPERMKPIPNKACEGRANPKGISYLYLSNEDNTSLSELRPHIGQYISLAQFRTNKDLKVVDCYSVKKHYTYLMCIFGPPLSQVDIGDAIWSMINDAFTKPVTNNETSTDYVTTQILAELFKSNGFDGACFKSGLGKGHNYILFDVDVADLTNCKVMEAKSISYKFSECDDRYFGEYKK